MEISLNVDLKVTSTYYNKSLKYNWKWISPSIELFLGTPNEKCNDRTKKPKLSKKMPVQYRSKVSEDLEVEIENVSRFRILFQPIIEKQNLLFENSNCNFLQKTCYLQIYVSSLCWYLHRLDSDTFPYVRKNTGWRLHHKLALRHATKKWWVVIIIFLNIFQKYMFADSVIL